MLRPVDDDWEAEAWATQVGDRLKELTHWLESGAGAPAPRLFSEQFFCEPLSPPTPQSQSLGTFHLQRSTAQQEGENLGITALQTWVAGLANLHIELKIVRVEQAERSLRTLVHYHLAASTRRERVQLNGKWACDWQREVAGPWYLSRLQPQSSERIVRGNGPLFRDQTAFAFQNVNSFKGQLSRGLDHWRDRLDWRFGWEVVGAHGLAVGDVNGDGRDDLYVAETGGVPNRLYLQQANGQLREHSHAGEVDLLEPTHGALLVDLDNDGDQDLIAACTTFLVVLSNDGRGTFRRRATHSVSAIARSLAAADFDNNGLVDIFVCGYSSRNDAVGLGRPLPYHDANNGAPNSLWSNLGDFQFTDVTESVGLTQNNSRFSYAAAWEDFDTDGDLDLYVANDFGRNNLYRNQNGHFEDVAAAEGVEDIAAGMSVSWGDYNRDGRVDLYVGNMFSSAGHRVAFQRRFKSGAPEGIRELYQRHARGNTLFEGVPDGTFRDVSLQAGVTAGRWAWSSNFVDINNDGWRDLVVANGMVTGDTTTDDL